MKVKCPGCGKLLSIPDSAAGKVVKCSCGKQLRAPGGKPSGGTPSGGTKPGGAKSGGKPAPAVGKPAASRPAAAPALDDELFGELTDQDLTPVKSVYSPGQKAPVSGGPVEDVPVKSKKKLIVIIVIVVVLLIGIGVGVAGYFMGWFGGEAAAAAGIMMN